MTMNLLTITNEVLKIKNVSIKCVRILDIVPSGGKTAGTERKGCDVCHRDRKLSGVDFGEYRVRMSEAALSSLPG